MSHSILPQRKTHMESWVPPLLSRERVSFPTALHLLLRPQPQRAGLGRAAGAVCVSLSVFLPPETAAHPGGCRGKGGLPTAPVQPGAFRGF